MENNISILIIEDEVLIAHSLKLLLEDFGYAVIDVCYNYYSALEAIEIAEYDLAISDINLGSGVNEQSGLSLMSYVREIKKCPFIFLTASSDTETIREAAMCKPSAYLVKPINQMNLHAAIQLAIENFRNAEKSDEPGEAKQPGFFYVKLGSRLVRIVWEDVAYMESTKNYVKVYTAEYKGGVLIRGSLQQVFNTMIPPNLKNLFIRVNRSMIFAKNNITEIGNGFVMTPFGKMECSADLMREGFKKI